MKKYAIFLGSTLVGHTLLESADAPMGVVAGKITFSIENPYETIKSYCSLNNIALNEDDSDFKVIMTQPLPGIKVLSPNGIEIKGVGSTINGMEEEGYSIDIYGISYPFYGDEFPHHVKAYNENTFQ